MLKDKCLSWLKVTLSVWLKNGLDETGFVECLDQSLCPAPGPRRALVQARQIYSLRVAKDLLDLPRPAVAEGVEKGLNCLFNNFALKDGSFLHSLNADLTPANPTPELYTQAFVLFGLAEAYSIFENKNLLERALNIVNYLQKNRRAKKLGFTEIKSGRTVFQSNPHMHLLEATLRWQELDSAGVWKELSQEIVELCLKHFIDPHSATLAEEFDADWEIFRYPEGFVVEPGHQFEWSWLLNWHQRLNGGNYLEQREKLFRFGEHFGIDRSRKVAMDQVWNSGKPKQLSARFWPQCERVKAALALGQKSTADQALTSLFDYFLAEPQGLWCDTQDELGRFDSAPSKASSLYHIIGAMNEYVRTSI